LAIRVLPNKESDTAGPATTSTESEKLKKALFPVDVLFGGAPFTVAIPSGRSQGQTHLKLPTIVFSADGVRTARSQHAFRKMLSPGGYLCKILNSKINFLESSNFPLDIQHRY
jgi:hypothetical protein